MLAPHNAHLVKSNYSYVEVFFLVSTTSTYRSSAVPLNLFSRLSIYSQCQLMDGSRMDYIENVSRRMVRGWLTLQKLADGWFEGGLHCKSWQTDGSRVAYIAKVGRRMVRGWLTLQKLANGWFEGGLVWKYYETDGSRPAYIKNDSKQMVSRPAYIANVS